MQIFDVYTRDFQNRTDAHAHLFSLQLFIREIFEAEQRCGVFSVYLFVQANRLRNLLQDREFYIKKVALQTYVDTEFSGSAVHRLCYTTL